MADYVVKKSQIDEMPGLHKVHFLNDNAVRQNKSLGDLVGLGGFGFHIIEVNPGCESTEFHQHHFEDECTYVLEGTGTVVIGEERIGVGPGDFIGYPAGGPAHTMVNDGDQVLRCIVVGSRLIHDVADYPKLGKRLFRNGGNSWNLVDIEHISYPSAGKK